MFDFTQENFETVKPILAAGFYKGMIASTSLVKKDSDGNEVPTICIQPEIKYENKKPVETGNFILKGSMNYTIALLSDKAKKTLMQDEPKVFGRMSLNFDQKTGKLDPKNNIVFAQIVKLFDLNLQEIFSAIDTSDLEDVEINEKFTSVENIKLLTQAEVFYNRFFTLFGQMISNLPVKVKISRRKNFSDPSIIEAGLDQGNLNQPFCGMLKLDDESFDYSASS